MSVRAAVEFATDFTDHGSPKELATDRTESTDPKTLNVRVEGSIPSGRRDHTISGLASPTREPPDTAANMIPRT